MAFPNTIPRMLSRSMSEWPARPFLQVRKGETIISQSFAQVGAEVRALARGLVKTGVGRGERIALLSENRREWVTSYLAVVTAGATVVPMDSLMSPPEISNILEQAHCRAMIVSRKFYATMRPAADEYNITLYSLEPESSGGEILLPRASDGHLPDPSPSDLAVIIFTSGTTGFSKGVMLTHENLCSDVEGVLSSIQIQPTDNFHLLLPLNHTYSSTVNMLVPLGGGGCATFATSYKSRDIVDDIRIAGVTLLIGVPQVYENIMLGMKRVIRETSAARRILFRALYSVSLLANYLGINAGKLIFKSVRKKAGMRSLRFMISGGAALHPEISRFFQRLGFTLLQGYGMTETSPIICVNRPESNRFGSVGPAIPGVDLRIDNPDPVSRIGEICARGRNVMLGYFENAEATAKVLQDGWMHTGDAGYLDRTGRLFITGRVKNIIVTGAGKNVYPEEIEALLNTSPYILESIVIGVERKRGAGEELCAILVPDKSAIELEEQSGNQVDLKSELDAAIEAYNKSVPQYRQIRQWKLREDEFEKTSTRKIKRFRYQKVSLDSKP